MEPIEKPKRGRPCGPREVAVMSCLCPICNGSVYRCKRHVPLTLTPDNFDLKGLTVEERCIVFLYAIGQDIGGYFDGRLPLGNQIPSEEIWEGGIWDEEIVWPFPHNVKDWEESAAKRTYLAGE